MAKITQKERTLSVTSDKFTAVVFQILPPKVEDDGSISIYVLSTLPARSTFDILWFRWAGTYLIDDMFVWEDNDDGTTEYRFQVVKP